jgi:ABC-2 type transport system permease protein
MNPARVCAVLLQEFYITKRSLEVIIDLPIFSFASIIIFGFINLFLRGGDNSVNGSYLMLGILFWEVIRVAQYSMSVGAMWNVWSRNLSNMFIAPLSIYEYFAAHIISSFAKVAVIFAASSLISFYFFNFNILSIGLLNLTLFILNLCIFAWALGILIMGLIFRFGTKIQALAWGMIFILQPFFAPFFPVEVMPDLMQKIAFLFPVTYIFEAARESLVKQGIKWEYIFYSFILNVIYLVSSVLIFKYLFRKSKDTGQFVRNEG